MKNNNCAHVKCEGTPIDKAIFLNERMDHMNGESGFCLGCLKQFADPLYTEACWQFR